MADDENQPRSEMGLGERLGNAFDFVFGGAMFLAFCGGLIAVYVILAITAVRESRWAFTDVMPERVCTAGQRHNCMIRTPAQVTAQYGRAFTVSLDRAPYVDDVDTLKGPAPAVGSRVVLERWNGRLVSVVDAQRGRRHAEEWPRRVHDLLEAAAALVVVMGAPAAIYWGILAVRRDLKACRVTEPPAQMS
jgi:hypothetical protein